VHPKTGWTGLFCHTHQHYRSQWLPDSEWSNFTRRSRRIEV